MCGWHNIQTNKPILNTEVAYGMVQSKTVSLFRKYMKILVMLVSGITT